MTKIKISSTINADLHNVIGRLATKLGQSNSQLIENILRKDPKISAMLAELQQAEEIPDYVIPKKANQLKEPELNSKLTA